MKRQIPATGRGWIGLIVTGLTFGTAALYSALARSADAGAVQTAHANAGDFVQHEHPSVGLCPWREQERDRRQFFPTATDVREETLILSGRRLEVARRLGRQSTAEENALKVYRILRRGQGIGSVVARRVRGESGVIELLLAVDTTGDIVGARVQRLREPTATAQVLQSDRWLGAFVGKNSASAWELGADIPAVPPVVRPSAEAVTGAAHTLLVLLAVADGPGTSGAVR